MFDVMLSFVLSFVFFFLLSSSFFFYNVTLFCDVLFLSSNEYAKYTQSESIFIRHFHAHIKLLLFFVHLSYFIFPNTCVFSFLLLNPIRGFYFFMWREMYSIWMKQSLDAMMCMSVYQNNNQKCDKNQQFQHTNTRPRAYNIFKDRNCFLFISPPFSIQSYVQGYIFVITVHK